LKKQKIQKHSQNPPQGRGRPRRIVDPVLSYSSDDSIDSPSTSSISSQHSDWYNYNNSTEEKSTWLLIPNQSSAALQTNNIIPPELLELQNDYDGYMSSSSTASESTIEAAEWRDVLDYFCGDSEKSIACSIPRSVSYASLFLD
jgi:hypothetical protein